MQKKKKEQYLYHYSENFGIAFLWWRIYNYGTLILRSSGGISFGGIDFLLILFLFYIKHQLYLLICRLASGRKELLRRLLNSLANQVEACKGASRTKQAFLCLASIIITPIGLLLKSSILINSIAQAPIVVHTSSEVIHPRTYMPGNKLVIAILHCKVEISLSLALVENLHPFRFQAFHSVSKHITKE